jgi:hypothetical protein
MSAILEVLVAVLEPALQTLPTTSPFESTYPHVARWVANYGWIELGPSEPYESMLRAFDQDGLVWESEPQIGSLDKTLRALDRHLEHWMNMCYGAQG